MSNLKQPIYVCSTFDIALTSEDFDHVFRAIVYYSADAVTEEQYECVCIDFPLETSADTAEKAIELCGHELHKSLEEIYARNAPEQAAEIIKNTKTLANQPSYIRDFEIANKYASDFKNKDGNMNQINRTTATKVETSLNIYFQLFSTGEGIPNRHTTGNVVNTHSSAPTGKADSNTNYCQNNIFDFY